MTHCKHPCKKVRHHYRKHSWKRKAKMKIGMRNKNKCIKSKIKIYYWNLIASKAKIIYYFWKQKWFLNLTNLFQNNFGKKSTITDHSHHYLILDWNRKFLSKNYLGLDYLVLDWNFSKVYKACISKNFDPGSFKRKQVTNIECVWVPFSKFTKPVFQNISPLAVSKGSKLQT